MTMFDWLKRLLGMSTVRFPAPDQLAEVDVADCDYQTEIVEIEGLVSPESQGGWPHGEYSVHSFSFAAWRRPGEELSPHKLLILRPVEPEGDWFAEYPKWSINRVRVLLSTDETRAIFAGRAARSPDPSGLREFGEELMKPVVIPTERFGELLLDRNLNWFEAEVLWNGQEVTLRFEPADGLDISAALSTAEKLWDDQVAWKQRVDDFVIESLLPVKNDGWLDENEAELTGDDFQSRIVLQSISFESNGDFTFWHFDGGIFLDHMIEVRGSLASGITSANLAG